MTLTKIEAYQGAISPQLASLPPILQRIYAARNVQSLHEVQYSLKHLLHFQSLKNIQKAADLLFEMIRNQKRILIVGDFDTDGATSTAVAIKALQQCGAKYVNYLVPNRFEYGYGLTKEIVALVKETDLIMTVDNGIASYEGVMAAKKKGIPVLITDHHLPPDTLPPAAVIINPQQAGDTFASKNLAGVGVTFYVMLALRAHLQQNHWFTTQNIPYPTMHHLLDLVALGTVADMVPLDLNNRILVAYGLRQMQSNAACPGIQALAEVSNKDLASCSASDLGFNIAPKLNAAGRLEDMSLGIECLLSKNKKEAMPLAIQLDELNKKRRLIEQDMQKTAFTNLERLALPSTSTSICLFDKQWHEGITGLVAGRLKERFQKPAVVFALTQRAGELKGSARSIQGLHIRDILADIAAMHPKLLSRFGGHAAAAGLTLAQKDYPQFVLLFEQYVTKALSNRDPLTVQLTDGTLKPEEMTLSVATLLKQSGPWGQGFAEPLFEGVFQVISQRLVGTRHLKIQLRSKQSNRIIKGIVFNVNTEEWPNSRIDTVQLLYRLTVEEWQGRKDISLQIEKIYPISRQ